MLSSDSFNEPFKPFRVSSDGRRSTIPDDLSETDVAFFAEIVEAIDDPWLKARLADLIWLMQSSRDVNFALVAIDNYRTIPLGTETQVRERDMCWQRAINLARISEQELAIALPKWKPRSSKHSCRRRKRMAFSGIG